MTTPNSRLWWMIVGAATALALAGCASGPAARTSAEAPAKSVPSENTNPVPSAPPSVAGAKLVIASARYVSIPGPLPEAKGVLAFLANDAGLRLGIVLTREQAEAASWELARITGQPVCMAQRVAVASGGQAEMGVTKWPKPDTGGVKIIVGGVEQKFYSRPDGTELEITPRIMPDGGIQLRADMRVTTLKGFIEYKVEGVPVQNGEVRVPSGFYQPVFSAAQSEINARLAAGQVVVFRADETSSRQKLSPDGQRVIGAQHEWPINGEKKTVLIFLSAKSVPSVAEPEEGWE